MWVTVETCDAGVLALAEDAVTARAHPNEACTAAVAPDAVAISAYPVDATTVDGVGLPEDAVAAFVRGIVRAHDAAMVLGMAHSADPFPGGALAVERVAAVAAVIDGDHRSVVFGVADAADSLECVALTEHSDAGVAVASQSPPPADRVTENAVTVGVIAGGYSGNT
ncbi:hypothetical protein [Mycobacterium sp.]|uniref:hypothetical protein n=1 Tax=Mycobacterium sp. TaxID=1785 RepID=UPI0028BE8CD8|nr:hypothetical protein [Mycobacterium sp.]